MNKNSNSYTLIYASVMVILVAIALSLTNGLLKEQQAKNGDLDKMSQILRSVKIMTGLKDAEGAYTNVIKDVYAIDSKGVVKISDDRQAFLVNVSKEVQKPMEQRLLPVYEALVDGRKKYILPVYGTGLWGPIWGYVAFNEDRKTIFAASFSHQGETPGLGAEIATTVFQKQFENKEVLKNNVFTSIAVLKTGQTAKDRDAVDGVSGGTITSKGLEAMLENSLKAYQTFFHTKQTKP